MRIGRTSGLAAALLLLLVACGSNGGVGGENGTRDDGSTPAGAEPEIDGTFTTVIGADPGNLHPHLSVLTVQRNVVSMMYDKLVYITEEGEELPWLAESWDVQPDSVTFTVRDDVTCADGTPLTPSDIAANFEFIVDPANESPARGTSVPPEMKATLDAAGWTEGADGIRAKDGKKLEVSLIHNSSRGGTTASAAELIAQWWTEVGVDVNSRGMPPTGYSEVIFESGSWDAALLPINLRLPTQLVPFVSGAAPPEGVNFAHLDNEEYLAAVDEAMQLPGAESCPKWEEGEMALYSANDMFGFADELIPNFDDGVTYAIGDAWIVAPTIRLWAP